NSRYGENDVTFTVEFKRRAADDDALRGPHCNWCAVWYHVLITSRILVKQAAVLVDIADDIR
ncbi:1841_t:CDS:1, partial [Paraglomus occultum]